MSPGPATSWPDVPTYDYQCLKCGARQEIRCSMSERMPSVACHCGGTAEQIIIAVPESFVRFRPYEFRRDKVVGNNGRLVGRSAEAQHEAYRRHYEGIRKNIKRLNRSGRRNAFSTDGWQYLGGMPGEMADSIGQQEGDKQAVVKDPVTFLKKTGMYVGEGE